MKITKAKIKDFEEQQIEYGTEVAVKNLIWEVAADLMKDIDVVRLKTVYGKQKAR